MRQCKVAPDLQGVDRKYPPCTRCPRGNNPGGLITWVQGRRDEIKLRPDHKLALLRDMDLPQRVKVARELMLGLVKLTRQAKAA